MKSIRIKDLEIVEEERQQSEASQQSTVATLAKLSVENAKKDALIGKLTQMVAGLNVEIAKLKGEIEIG